MDCCKPSCAWQDMYEQTSCSPNNNQIDPNWRSIYVVDHDGNRMTRKDDKGVLKPYISDQPDQKFNCSHDPGPATRKVCYYNDTCRPCSNPDDYCTSCKQIGDGKPANTTLASKKTQWIPDIFNDEESMNAWLGPPNNGGMIACDPTDFPKYK